jgi:hypothetical protein
MALVHRTLVLAVLNLFLLAFVSTASAKGQWKSRTSQTSCREPSLQMIYTSCFLNKTVTINTFLLAIFLRPPPLEMIFKNCKSGSKNRKKIIREGRHLPAPLKLQVVAFFTRFTSGGIRTCDLPLARYSPNHCTSHSLVSIIYFFSPHIMLNRV